MLILYIAFGVKDPVSIQYNKAFVQGIHDDIYKYANACNNFLFPFRHIQDRLNDFLLRVILLR